MPERTGEEKSGEEREEQLWALGSFSATVKMRGGVGGGREGRWIRGE